MIFRRIFCPFGPDFFWNFQEISDKNVYVGRVFGLEDESVKMSLRFSRENSEMSILLPGISAFFCKKWSISVWIAAHKAAFSCKYIILPIFFYEIYYFHFSESGMTEIPEYQADVIK